MISDDDWYNPTIHCSTGAKLPVDESTMPNLSILKKYINKQMRITLPVRHCNGHHVANSELASLSLRGCPSLLYSFITEFILL
jgi:hypothetical protein